jgi:hypothetical protein
MMRTFSKFYTGQADASGSYAVAFNYHGLYGSNPLTPVDDLRKKYKNLAALHHPDRNRGTASELFHWTFRFKEIFEAQDGVAKAAVDAEYMAYGAAVALDQVASTASALESDEEIAAEGELPAGTVEKAGSRAADWDLVQWICVNTAVQSPKTGSIWIMVKKIVSPILGVFKQSLAQGGLRCGPDGVTFDMSPRSITQRISDERILVQSQEMIRGPHAFRDVYRKLLFRVLKIFGGAREYSRGEAIVHEYRDNYGECEPVYRINVAY